MASKSQSNTGNGANRKRTTRTRTPNRSGQRRSNGHHPTERRQQDRNGLERGDIFFFYRPDTEQSPPGGLLDVNRFQVVLRPEGQEVLRSITIGKKKLPGDDGDGRHWGFVDGVFREPEALRQALAGAGDESQSGRDRAAAVPAGEGVYALARHGRNTVLAYALELPEEPGEVQRAFNIARQGRFTLVVKNPQTNAPEGVGLDEDRRANFPEELMAKFGDRKWIGAEPPELLDYEGAELVLIAGQDGGEDLGIDLEPQPEDEENAEIFHDLHLEMSERTVKPLFEGTWK